MVRLLRVGTSQVFGVCNGLSVGVSKTVQTWFLGSTSTDATVLRFGHELPFPMVEAQQRRLQSASFGVAALH